MKFIEAVSDPAEVGKTGVGEVGEAGGGFIHEDVLRLSLLDHHHQVGDPFNKSETLELLAGLILSVGLLVPETWGCLAQCIAL